MIYHPRAGVVELVDARVSNTRSLGIVGSIPTTRTTIEWKISPVHALNFSTVAFYGQADFRRKLMKSCANEFAV